MSMRITYLKDHDGHKAYKNYFIERTLARRLCENGVALPHVTYMESIKKATEIALKEKAAEDEKKKAAEDEKKKAELIKEKKEAKAAETAISKKAKKREKAKIKIDK